jgi:hypothetical protein
VSVATVASLHDKQLDRAERGSRFRIRGASPTQVGMRFHPRLPFEDWEAIGSRIGLHLNASAWWLGDWLAFGQFKYGRRYKQGIELTGLDYQTLRNYAVVARRFDLPRRREKLSFQHHAELCALTDADQEVWLDRAEANKWSRNALRAALRRERLRGGDVALMATVRLPVADDQRRRWAAAAERSDCDLEDWIVRTLDGAAEELFDVIEGARFAMFQLEAVRAAG